MKAGTWGGGIFTYVATSLGENLHRYATAKIKPINGGLVSIVGRDGGNLLLCKEVT